MRYFVFSYEGLSDDMRAALTRGLGLSPRDAETCARHCRRYGVDELATFVEELEEAQASLATAKALGFPIQVDWCGRLCYDVPPAPDRETKGGGEEAWKDDVWFASLLGETRSA